MLGKAVGSRPEFLSPVRLLGGATVKGIRALGDAGRVKFAAKLVANGNASRSALRRYDKAIRFAGEVYGVATSYRTSYEIRSRLR